MSERALEGRRIGVLGGDARELILVRELLRQGAALKLAGYPDLPELAAATRVVEVEEVLTEVEAVLAPMSNTDAQGVIQATLDPKARLALRVEHFRLLNPGTPFFIGMAKPCIKEWAAAAGVRVIETAEVEEIAVLNSIPTAEGAIQIAMEELPVTIHGSRAVVLGFGRCGITLAERLAALGAHTTVVARNSGQRARAEAMGLAARPLAELATAVAEAEVVFNTIPAPVLGAEVIRMAAAGRRPLIIDLASAPGGTDFAAAEAMGLKAILALGLPGKVAPQTAGEILARTVPRLLVEALARGA